MLRDALLDTVLQGFVRGNKSLLRCRQSGAGHDQRRKQTRETFAVREFRLLRVNLREQKIVFTGKQPTRHHDTTPTQLLCWRHDQDDR